MIDPKDRFWVDGGGTNGIHDNVFIMDWDQRRHYSVHGPSQLLMLEDEEIGGEPGVEILKRHLDSLDPEVHTIWVDATGSLVKTSSSLDDDPERMICYPSRLDAPSLNGCEIIEMPKLQELDRLAQGVDLVNYTANDGTVKTAVFKNIPILQWIDRLWREMQILINLPAHPCLVPLDRIVVDDTSSQQILGFTLPYMPGQSLDKSTDQIFRLEWLHQLISVVDFLNLELRVSHQDVAPRNIICLEGARPEYRGLRLFDFGYASAIGLPYCVENRNDVKGVIFTLYEIITLDESYRELPHWEQDPDAVMNLEEWPQRRGLDAGVSVFRRCLEEWVRRRKDIAATQADRTPPPEIPEKPKPRPIITGLDVEGKPIRSVIPCTSRSVAQNFGNNIVSLRRPPSVKPQGWVSTIVKLVSTILFGSA